MNDDILLQISQIKIELQDLFDFSKKIVKSLYDQNLVLVRKINELETELNKYKHE